MNSPSHDLDELAKLEAAATPGPWVGFTDGGKPLAMMPAGRDGDICEFSKPPSDADFYFVLTFRNAAKSLIERVRAAEERTTAATDVLAERKRQIEVEGWEAEHDDAHTGSELAFAAAAYCDHAARKLGDKSYRQSMPSLRWPWTEFSSRTEFPLWWKPTTPRRDLVKAAALILAEIERLDRAASFDPLRAGEDDGTSDELETAIIYAENLATALVRKHHPEETTWAPLRGDLIGLLTQIANAVAGLVKPDANAQSDAETIAGLRAEIDEFHDYRDSAEAFHSDLEDNLGLEKMSRAAIIDAIKAMTEYADAKLADAHTRGKAEGQEEVRRGSAGRVGFYEREFYPLSNFSAFNLEFASRTFATSEHAYHYMKFIAAGDNPPLMNDGARNIAYAIRNAPSAHEAFKIAERNKALRRTDWDNVKLDIMRRILRAKADQHEYARRKLLETGGRELVEDSWRDDYWGLGPNGDGQNMLGKLWMEIRAEIRGQS